MITKCFSLTTKNILREIKDNMILAIPEFDIERLRGLEREYRELGRFRFSPDLCSIQFKKQIGVEFLPKNKIRIKIPFAGEKYIFLWNVFRSKFNENIVGLEDNSIILCFHFEKGEIEPKSIKNILDNILYCIESCKFIVNHHMDILNKEVKEYIDTQIKEKEYQESFEKKLKEEYSSWLEENDEKT